MSFINWGEESPDQKKIRREFEEQQMMFEQAVRFSKSSASMSGGAAGGSRLAESLPEYCGGDKTIVDYSYWGFDVLKNKKFVPTSEEFDTFVYDGTEISDQIEFRNEWMYIQRSNLESINFYNRPATGVYPTPIPTPDIFYRTNLTVDSPTSWYSNNVNGYTEWAASGADVELPEVTKLRTLPAVNVKAEFPATGLPGDIIYVINTDSWYAWNQTDLIFDSTYYDDYIASTHTAMKELADTSINIKRDLIQSLQPLLWSAKYIPEFRIKKDNL
jgi:hypothetical protein